MTMGAQYMPGPYKAKGHKIVTDTPVECLVAKVTACSGQGFNREEIGEFRSEEMATAKLLAASWDLLAALEEIMAQREARIDRRNRKAWERANDRSRAAIAKARGA